MPIHIEKPGGGTYTKEEIAALGVANGKAETLAEHIAAGAAPTTRTRLTIATELDATEHALAKARGVVRELESDVKRLGEELRYFGVKRRAKKATP
jgi:hypothetical protein